MPEISYLAVGSGPTGDQAWNSCLGEAAEILSILRRKEDTSFEGYDLNRQNPSPIAAEFVTSADATSPTDPGNEGAAAGASFRHAATSALLERFERAAIHNWWTGQQDAIAVPREWTASAGTDNLVSSARMYAEQKRTYSVIVLELRYSVWTMAAISRDADGRTPVVGYGAGLDPLSAARKAIGEMLQMEFGLHIANSSTAAQKSNVQSPVFRRIRALENERAHLISPKSEVSLFELKEDSDGRSILEIAERHLGKVTLVDLTRDDIGVPVCRALTPELPTARHLKFSGGASPL